MNLDAEGARELAGFWRGTSVAERIRALEVDVCVFVPFPYLMAARDALADSGVSLGAQDVYFEKSGAFTGEVSAGMLIDCGVTHVLVGHSERRHVIGEDDALVARKARAVIEAGMICVLCVGETLQQRERGEADQVNERQTRAALSGLGAADLGRVIIAYEPVWAIGTGRTASPEDAQNAHVRIRTVVARMFSEREAETLRMIYGGSVKASNARELFSQRDIDGGLIGGASLDAKEFLSIIGSA